MLYWELIYWRDTEGELIAAWLLGLKAAGSLAIQSIKMFSGAVEYVRMFFFPSKEPPPPSRTLKTWDIYMLTDCSGFALIP